MILAVAGLGREAVAAQVDPLGRSVLFIRGADGSGGARSRGDKEHRTEELSSIHESRVKPGNHGFGSLATALRNDGFQVRQLIESEGKLTVGGPVGRQRITWLNWSANHR